MRKEEKIDAIIERFKKMTPEQKKVFEKTLCLKTLSCNDEKMRE